ncbi:hypothetical protein QBC44DRAFT_383290 [Cladorrhinum sp. PSN332]|nr:hypothetical protein QBC44DRAFT_383290 [Cladorrhinum sp. PSN332]
MPPTPLEKLPQELLDELTLYLPCASRANLVACSKILCQRLQPSLYGPRALGHRNFAVYWACNKGHGATIRRAVAYGSSPTFVDTPSEIVQAQRIRSQVIVHPRREVQDPQQLALFLAAKHFRLDTFTTLLGLGATIHHDAVGNSSDQCQKMMSNLSRHPEKGFPFLQALFGAGLHKEIEARHSPLVALPLVTAVKAKASPTVLEFFLNHGAATEQAISTKDRVLSTPLSAAFSLGSYANIDFLLSRGADIHGGGHGPPFGSASHIPLFAAAGNIIFLGPQILKLCLEKGADINQRACVKGGGRSRCYDTTLLLHYLDSLNHNSFEKNFQTAMPLEDGLSCLVEQGAAIDPHLQPPTPRHSQLPSHWKLSSPPSPIELLFNNLGLEMLRNTKFLALVKRLVELGAAGGPATAHLVSNFDVNPGELDSNVWSHFYVAWDSFLDLLLTAQRSKPCINRMLTKLIVHRGISRNIDLELPVKIRRWHRGRPAREYRGIGYCGTSVFNRLLAAGADINYQTGGGPPVLHQLCLAWNEEAASAPEDLEEDHMEDIILQRRRILLTMLIERGASP